jgi:hypothetical protein
MKNSQLSCRVGPGIFPINAFIVFEKGPRVFPDRSPGQAPGVTAKGLSTFEFSLS